MDSANGVRIEEEKNCVIKMIDEEEPVKEGDGVNNIEQVPSENGRSETAKQAKEMSDASVAETKLCRTISKGKPSNLSKRSNGGSSQNIKTTKNRDIQRGPISVASKTRPTLTQSLSFPTRGHRADSMRSSDGITVKPSVAKTEATSSNRTSSLAKGPTSSGAENSRRTISASLPAKLASSNGTAKKAVSEDSVYQNPGAIETSVCAKVDEDTRSTTSSTATPGGQRRTSVAGFSFRLNDRAEKRKEFNSKLEEKIHAKEVEKSNLQAKSKENQEAEIKQLRKSLTFKAAPMPSFYREPPPKVELKKIPTTRAISPKLGRQKISMIASENDGSCYSPKLAKEQDNSHKDSQANNGKSVTGSKKLIKRTQSKLKSRESLVAKISAKPDKTNSKPTQGQNENAEENKNEALNSNGIEEQKDVKSEKIDELASTP